MEQLYLIEIFVKNVTIFLDANDTKTNTKKELFIRGTFGPKNQFLFKEGMMAPAQRDNEIITGTKKVSTDIKKEESATNKKSATSVASAENYQDKEYEDKTKWTRVFRVGKSILFPAFPDDLLLILDKYPLEFSIWAEGGEQPELIGAGNMYWHTQYYSHIKENMDTCKPLKSLSSKEKIPIMNECCCTVAGELQFVLRLSPLGPSIMCEYQQLLDKNPDIFVFRTDKCASLYQCKRIELDDKEYRTTGSIYEIACREDPEVMKRINRKIEICSELESCGIAQPGTAFTCQHQPGAPQDFKNVITPKEYPIEKIKMGEIVGPCGNTNCLLAHKMRNFIRNQYAYKKEAGSRTFSKKSNKSKRVCGKCGCSHDLWHSERAEPLKNNPVCQGCGGIAQSGETCDDRLKRLYGTGLTPISSKTDLKK